jgi:GAF domain-containing protein
VREDITRDAICPYQTADPRSHLIVPIKRHTQVMGVIGLESILPNGFTADNIDFLTHLAEHAAIAIENAQLYGQTKRRIAELESLQKISLGLTSSLQLEAVLDSIVLHSHRLIGADQVAIYLYDEQEEKLYYGTKLSDKGTETLPIPIDSDQITTEVARRRKAIVIHNAQGQHSLSDVVHPLNNSKQGEAIASIPVIKSNRILGILDVLFQSPHVFTRGELHTLNLLADQAAIAIENAQLYAGMQRARDAKNEFISAISRDLKVPMTLILGYTRLLAMKSSDPITEQQKAFLEIIQKNVRRLNELVDSLQDLSNTEPERSLPPAVPADI